MKKEENENYFLKIVIGFILVLIAFDFFLSEPKYELSFYIILSLALLIIMLLADNFDKLSIPKIISLEKNVKEKDKKIEKLNDVTLKLIDQVVSVSSSNVNNSINLNVTKNSDKKNNYELEEKVEIEKDVSNPNHTKVNATKANERKKYMNAVFLYSLEKGLNFGDRFNISRDVEIEIKDNNINKIMKKSVIFDGLAENGVFSIFYDVCPFFALSSFNEHLFFKLNLLKEYSEFNRTFSKLHIIFPILDDDLNKVLGTNYRINLFYEKINEKFGNAIDNNMLELKKFNVSKEDIDNYLKENEKNIEK